jgi:DNA-binding transcriptional ArsR family regulator
LGVARVGAPAVEDGFGILSHPLRRTLIRRMAAGECRVGDLADGLDVTRPAVSQHLRLMLEVGVVTESRRGRERWYQLAQSAFDDVRDFLAYIDEFWTTRLDALERFLGEQQ